MATRERERGIPVAAGARAVAAADRPRPDRDRRRGRRRRALPGERALVRDHRPAPGDRRRDALSDLTGKTVVVTGASRGIGAAAAAAIGAGGATVVAHYGSYREGAEEAVAARPRRAQELRPDRLRRARLGPHVLAAGARGSTRASTPSSSTRGSRARRRSTAPTRPGTRAGTICSGSTCSSRRA